MHIAALVSRLRQNLAQGRTQPRVIVGDHEFDAVEAAGLQRQQKIPPARSALPVGELDRQHLAPTVPIDADRDQHRVARDHPGLAHPLVARVQDQIGEGFGQRTAGKLRQVRIQSLVDRADRRGREAVAAQLLGDRLHLTGRNPLHVHLRQRRHQRPLRALIAFEQFGGEPPGSVLRNAQLKLANPRDQRPVVITRTVAQPARRPLALLGPQRLGHLRFEHLLQRRPHPAPGGTPRPPPEGLSRRSSQTYLSSRSWCASSPKDPLTAKSPAYHGHRLHRILLNPPNTTGWFQGHRR